MINGAAFISNGATSNSHNNQKSLNLNIPFKQASTESEEKTRINLQNIVRKIILLNKIII